MITGGGQGGTTTPQIDFSIFLPVLTGAGSIIGAIFGYVILPIWVFYLLKDRVALTEAFDRSLPPTWRFDVLGGPPHRAARLRAVGAGAVDPRDHGRRLHLHRPDAAQPDRGSRVRPLRRAPVGHRRHPGARARHRPDHLGDPGGPARGDRRSRAGHRRPRALHARPADREQPARAEDPGRRGRAAPGRGHLRDHHRRIACRPPWGDPCPAGDRRRPRCRALPVPQAQSGGLRRARLPRSRASASRRIAGSPSRATTVSPGDGSAA